MLDGCTPWPHVFAERYRAAGHWRGHTLDDLLRGCALRYGPRTALVQGDTRLTYGQLNRRVERMAAGFRLRGLRPGQRVVVQLPNVPELVITAFALMRAGTIPVFCPVTHREPQVSHAARVTEAAGYVGPSVHDGFDHRGLAADIAARWPFLRRVFSYEPPGTASPYGGLATDASGCHYFPLASVDAPPDRPLVRSADEVAFFLLAADTTDTPRLVPRTHDDYACQARAAAEAAALAEDDVYLAAPSAEFTLTLGCPGIIGTLMAGGTVVQAETGTPAECLTLIERERVTHASLAPADARHWLRELPANGADLGSLRLVQLGVGPAEGATAEELGTASACRVQRVQAMPEGPLILTSASEPHGRPLSPDDEVRIVDAEGKGVPEGEPGELLVRGPYTVRGYYRAPDLDARSFTDDGYFRTGVVARLTPGRDEGHRSVSGI
ncbi:2,3-dihydroxybenzoyl adenylate synthase [Streptomyces aquilus]|uniref:2,3-dihydroxybenzoyl adenylate synthase n=2 Tax=Streptomyces aquilus TaxID=2548456 RepID=A0A3S9HTJ9_9ACTN|nr:AMP-binding protein [Streptomyces aquilus]AZP15357.1 2,3-dihydroxybenzoyl adenylate synthase [Streptomyces aquilus]